MASSMNEDNILDEKIKQIESDMEAVRTKENRLKFEFEKQVKDQVKSGKDAHAKRTAQLRQIDVDRETHDLERRKLELSLEQLVSQLDEKEQAYERRMAEIDIKKKVAIEEGHQL